jgi:HD-GYP domain-containing protein (c-di-GMP phosphodiesterase class II)
MDPGNIFDSNSLVEKADAALYTAKQKGRNCVVCWDDRRPFCAVAKPNPEVSSFNDLREKIFSLTKKLEDQVMGTVSAFIKTMEISLDDPKAGHLAEKVKIYAERIAEEMNLGEELKERIRTAALVKDLGHISVPQNILRKAEPLSDEEIRIFQQHPVATARILEPIGIFDSELQIIKHHHERFDGSGYPSGLKGKEIMIGARVLAVADEFVELCVGGLDMEAALEEMRKGSGSKFDPDVVEAFVKAFEKNSDKWETEAVSMAVIASG